VKTYAETIEYLYGLRLFGAKFGLENTFKLAALAGNPQNQLRFIHVAGTNGKGSTCALLESIYRSAGLRVGLFTSPHLVSFRERIQVNRQLIPEADVIRMVEYLQPLLKQFPDDHHPTFFEVITTVALQYFFEQKCDLVIWETGLGGRLDATNIVTPLASVITNIAFDHQQWLGNTLEKIAAEKGGIIKPNVPILTSTDAPEALRVIEQIAREKNAPLTHIDGHHASRITHHLALSGDHQKINAALALATVQVLQPQIPVREESIDAGMKSVSWPGRLQLIQIPDGRKILLDGAHNAAGATTLRAALLGGSPVFGTKQSEMNRPSPGSETRAPLLIFGALADKKWLEICSILAPIAGKVITVRVAGDRTAAPAELAAAFHSANPHLHAETAANLAEALNACKHEPFIVITGSLYLVGEALEQLGFSPANTGERGLNEWTAPKNLR